MDAYLIAEGDSSHVRPIVYRRDRGVCAACGLNTDRLGRVARTIGWWAQCRDKESHGFHAATRLRDAGAYWIDPERRGAATYVYVRACVLLRYGWTPAQAKLNRTLWEADHAVPVAEGGGGCGLENYRTLCVPCHTKASAELMRRLRARAG